MVTSIENLPEEVLLYIFDYLDGKSVKSTALVCKNWNDVITGSSRIMKKFTLNLCVRNKWTDKFEEVMNLRRRFHSMGATLLTQNVRQHFCDTQTDNDIPLLMQVSVKHGTHVRELVLTNAEFKNPNHFYELLDNMPLLSELEVSKVKFNCEGAFALDKPVILRKLTKLTVKTCDWNLFQFFMATPIKELNISNKLTHVNDQQRNTYIRFLETSNTLESIEFDLVAYAKTFQKPLEGKICFKLRSLRYLSFSPSYETGHIDRNFATFLESQASSLKVLHLNYVLPNIITTIFTKIKVLEKLRLNSVVPPVDQDFYYPFKQMSNLKEVILHDDITSEVAVKEILSNCNNLESLTAIHDPSQHVPNLLPFIAEHCPNIKRLYLDTLLVIVPLDIKFNHLNFLHIETCISFECLITFLKCNATIETLSLNLVEDEIIPDDGILKDLLSQPNLDHLTISAHCNTLKAIFKKIKLDYRKLKSLEMKSLTRSINNVYFKYSNNQTEWDADDTFFEDNK